MSLFSPLALPSGALIRNRIAKAAMEENMADADHAPSEALLQLYQRWADGGAGLIITGNVMVDGRAMTGPGGVVLETIATWSVSSPGPTPRARAGCRCGCRSTTPGGRCRPRSASRHWRLRRSPWTWAHCPNSSRRRGR